MYGGSISLKSPMLYAMGFIWLFAIGGLTGLFLGALATDIAVHDTYFIVAHFHYVMVGSTLFAFLGGLHYWWPKMFGRMYNEFWATIAAIVVFIGFNMTFFIQFIAGSQGMPRRYADFPAKYAPYHVISTFGAYLLGHRAVHGARGVDSLAAAGPEGAAEPVGRQPARVAHRFAPAA